MTRQARQNDPISDDDHPPPDTSSPDTSARDVDRARDAHLVGLALGGDPDAFGQLYDAWFDRVYALVHRIIHDDEIARDVCQDAFLSAWRNLANLEDHASFGGWLLRIARNAGLNRLEREQRSRPIDSEGLAMIERLGTSPVSAPAGLGVESRLSRAQDPELAASDHEIVALVWEVVGTLGERDAEVLDLQLRASLSPAEVGQVLGLNRNAANQLCHRVRARFATAFGARMLWNGANPSCPQLAAALAAAGVDRFDADAVRITDQHAGGCAECDERRGLRLQPAALFSALPIAVAPALLKAEVAAALAAEGVPMGTALPPPPPPAPPPAPPPSSTLTPLVASTSFEIGRRMGRAPIAVAAALFVLVGLLIAATQLGGDDETSVLAGAAGTTEAVEPSAEPGSTSATTVAAGGPGSTANPPATDPASTSTTHAPTTTEPSTTTTTLPPATIDLLTVEPSTAQPYNYLMGPTSPQLSWSVSDADTVEVTMWFDDGESGPQFHSTVSTDPSGSMAICPGTVNDEACLTPAGRYTFVVEATDADGNTVSSDVDDPPGFDVMQPIIG